MARRGKGKHERERDRERWRDRELSKVNCVTAKTETGEREGKRHILLHKNMPYSKSNAKTKIKALRRMTNKECGKIPHNDKKIELKYGTEKTKNPQGTAELFNSNFTEIAGKLLNKMLLETLVINFHSIK
jgi:hypothetical protein